MDTKTLILLVVVALVNLAAFLVILWDKSRSRKAGAERISEATIFLLAAAMGSVGVYAGMLLFRHKTRKWQFIVGIPLLMIQNAAFLYLVYTYLAGGL
jgi:uncharacterized membrane protein YsdA (DUF1294 family)